MRRKHSCLAGPLWGCSPSMPRWPPRSPPTRRCSSCSRPAGRRTWRTIPISATALGDHRYNDAAAGHVAGGHRPGASKSRTTRACRRCARSTRQAREGRPAQLRPVRARNQASRINEVPVQAVDVRHRAPAAVRSCWPRSPSSRRSRRSRTTTTGSRASMPAACSSTSGSCCWRRAPPSDARSRAVIVQKVLEQIKPQLVTDPEASRFYAPFKKMPASIPAAEKDRLTAAGKAAIQTVAMPAFQRFDKFFREVYLPASRDTVGIYDIAGRRPVLPQPHQVLHDHRQPGCRRASTTSASRK